jgi:hypothetical protein
LINIQGSNPATINVGATYTDLGAVVHDNQGYDLSNRTFINGILSGDILIDTSQIATDTITSSPPTPGAIPAPAPAPWLWRSQALPHCLNE